MVAEAVATMAVVAMATAAAAIAAVWTRAWRKLRIYY
jgi:hypothetical protein